MQLQRLDMFRRPHGLVSFRRGPLQCKLRVWRARHETFRSHFGPPPRCAGGYRRNLPRGAKVIFYHFILSPPL